MSTYQHAQRLAGLGFNVFPLIEGLKLPQIEDFPNRATCDPTQIAQWWGADFDPTWTQPFNVGISSTSFGNVDGVSLCVTCPPS